jgi:hypothetical protein
MRQALIALALAAGVAITPLAGTAHAAPATACIQAGIDQNDMAGQYVSIEHRMRLTIYPCAGSELLWSDRYGTHEAMYQSVERLPNGSIIGVVAIPDPVVYSLDNRRAISIKPSDPGFIEVWTVGPFGDHLRIYRLRKIS